MAEEIAADPRYADEEQLGPDEGARARFRDVRPEAARRAATISGGRFVPTAKEKEGSVVRAESGGAAVASENLC